MFKFETLEIWKDSVSFISDIYRLTEKFPNWESYNLTSQISRAATSVSLNIAEGASRGSKKDFKRFIQMAIGSLYEVVTCLYIAKNQKYIDNDEFKTLYDQCERISKMIHGFSNYLNK